MSIEAALLNITDNWLDTLVCLFSLALMFRLVGPLRFPPSKVHRLGVKGKRVVLNIWVSGSQACLRFDATGTTVS